ncbi:MAG: hypothetical protein JRG73_14305 [Deltaproteobacteria bacterium]|nr:hypothetical protein [Deltaproteobacteria bacterium]MBW2308095.1 hypothetical protein [Deltaproteobacteria bacterium]
MSLYLKACLVLLVSFLLGACYESRVPMALSKDSTIDLNLIGKWKGILKLAETLDEVTAEMQILKFNDNEYYVSYNAGTNGNIDHSNLRAYTVMVDGVPFINVQCIDDMKEATRTFMFFKYSVSGDRVLTLELVSDDFVKTKFKTSDELYEFIKKNLNNEKIYEKPVRFKLFNS